MVTCFDCCQLPLEGDKLSNCWDALNGVDGGWVIVDFGCQHFGVVVCVLRDVLLPTSLRSNCAWSQENLILLA